MSLYCTILFFKSRHSPAPCCEITSDEHLNLIFVFEYMLLRVYCVHVFSVRFATLLLALIFIFTFASAALCFVPCAAFEVFACSNDLFC